MRIWYISLQHAADRLCHWTHLAGRRHSVDWSHGHFGLQKVGADMLNVMDPFYTPDIG